MALTLDQALENIYQSLHNNNMDIDDHIKALKETMAADGATEVTMESAKLAQNNRQGRKMLQSYFKKRGVDVKITL